MSDNRSDQSRAFVLDRIRAIKGEWYKIDCGCLRKSEVALAQEIEERLTWLEAMLAPKK